MIFIILQLSVRAQLRLHTICVLRGLVPKCRACHTDSELNSVIDKLINDSVAHLLAKQLSVSWKRPTASQSTRVFDGSFEARVLSNKFKLINDNGSDQESVMPAALGERKKFEIYANRMPRRGVMFMFRVSV